MTTPASSSDPAVTLREERGVVVMSFPPGRMRSDAVREMYELTVHHITQPNTRLLVDLTGVTYVSSAGLGMFVTLRKKCLGVGSQMLLAVPDADVMETFHLTHLDKLLPLFSSREEAFSRFKPPALEEA